MKQQRVQPVLCEWCKKEFIPRIGYSGVPSCCSMQCSRKNSSKRFHDCRINRLKEYFRNKYSELERYDP